MQWTTQKIVATSAGLFLTVSIPLVLLYGAMRTHSEIPKGWSVIRGSVDQWVCADNKIKVHSDGGETLLVSSREYQDVTVSAIVTSTNREASLALRMEDADNGYLAIFGPSVTPAGLDHGVLLVRKKAGEEHVIGAYRGRLLETLGATAKLTFQVKGSWLEVFLNDTSVVRVKDTSLLSGFIGLRIFGSGEFPCDAEFSRISFH